MDEDESTETYVSSTYSDQTFSEIENNQDNVESKVVGKRKGRPPNSRNKITKTEVPTRKSSRTKQINACVEVNGDNQLKIQNKVKQNIHTSADTTIKNIYVKDGCEDRNNCKLSVSLVDCALDSTLVKKYNLMLNTNGISKEESVKKRKSKESSEETNRANLQNKLEVPKVTINTNDNGQQNNVISDKDEKTTEPIDNVKKLKSLAIVTSPVMVTSPVKLTSPVAVTSPAKSETSSLTLQHSSPIKITTSNLLLKENPCIKVNMYPVVKPFNITINVGQNNQERKVEFSAKPISSHTESVISPTNLSVKSDSLFSELSISDPDTLMPVLQFYSGDWFFDVTNENLYKILTCDSIFKNAVLPLLSPMENNNSFEKDSTFSANTTFQFTKPILPPAKRPPTRKKFTSESSRSLVTSTDSLYQTDQQTSSSVTDDDAISLYSAWSIKSSDFYTNLTNSKSEVNLEKSISNENEPTRLSTKPSSPSLIRSITTKVNSTTIKNVSKLPDISQKQNVLQWLENSEQDKYVDFSLVPPVFKSLCYNFYKYNNCKKHTCERKHHATKFIRDQVSSLNYNSLLEAYLYARSRSKIVLALVNEFMSSFVRFSKVSDLITMAGDIAVPENSQRISHINQIITVLQSFGRSFTQSVEEIMTNKEGNNVALSDVLLTIVCENKQNLCANWCLIEKLCHYRNSYPVHHKLIDDLMMTCVDEGNVELSLKLVKGVFMKDYVDLKTISTLLFGCFISFLESKNLTEEVNILIERAKWYNVNIVTSFPKSNSVWLDKPHCVNSFQENCTNSNNIQGNLQNHNFQFNLTSPIEKFNLLKDSMVESTGLQYNQVQQAPPQTNFDNRLVPNNWSDNLFQGTQQCGNNVISTNSKVIDTTSESDIEKMSTDSDETCTSLRQSINNSILDNAISTSNHSSPSITNKNIDFSEKFLTDFEIKKLSDVIFNNQCDELIAMYNKFKNSSFNSSFVMNVIGFLKQKNNSVIYEIINSFINGLEQLNSHFAYINNAESTLYLLVVNTIALLKQKKGYKEAAALLYKFNGNLDNLLKVQWFRSIQRHSLSYVGKYLYFCQVFMRGRYLQESLAILKSPELKLLYPITTWTLQHHQHFDNEFRNNVLEEFINIALRENLKIAKDVILHMITSKDNVTELNVWTYFDQLILALLNSNGTYITDLIQMLPNILQGWYKYLKKTNMRGLLVKLVSAKIPEKQLLYLYNKCLKQRMYHKIKGNETKIIIKTDMTLEEIFITIRYYFYKLEQSNYEVQEVTVLLKMPEQLSSQPQILINSDCRTREAQERIMTVLARCFPTAVVARVNEKSHLFIRPDQIKLCVEHYRKSNSSSKSVWVRQSAVEKLAISDTINSFEYNNTLYDR